MEITHRISCVSFLIAGLVFFITGCSFKSDVEKQQWFRYASKFDKAFSKVWASGGEIQAYNKTETIVEEFLQVQQPTETEILSVLRSSNKELKRTGLVAMYLNPIETEQVTEILFRFLQDSDSEFKWYAVHSLQKFTGFPESEDADLRTRLLEIIKNERDLGLMVTEITLLAKLPSEEVVAFLTEQLMKEGNEIGVHLLRIGAFHALKEMGSSYYDEAASYINEHGSPEAKKQLLKQEESWTLVQSE